MTSAYILIAFLATGDSGGPVSAEFDNELACENAAFAINSLGTGRYDNRYWISFAECFPKGDGK